MRTTSSNKCKTSLTVDYLSILANLLKQKGLNGIRITIKPKKMEILVHRKETYTKHAKEFKIASKIIYDANPTWKLVISCARYKINPEVKKAASVARYKINPGKQKAVSIAKYKINPEKQKAAFLARYKINPEKQKAASIAKYPEKQKAASLARR